MRTTQIKEIKKYQTEDGTVFDTMKEAEEYVQLTSTDLYKSLIERVQKLEQELAALKIEVATKSWTPQAIINKPPYLQPMYSAYNQATGQPEKEQQ